MNSFNASAIAVLFAVPTFAAPTITDVTAQQRYPWNGKVDIAYTISGNVQSSVPDAMVAILKVTATDQETGTSYTASSLSGDTDLSDGTHSLVWDMAAQGLSLKSTNVIFSVSCATTPAIYCVIDLSAGSSASSYAVTYLAEPPSSGFNVDAYKTTKLVLKRMEAGSFKMQDASNVTLTKPFFIGLFEVTQKQYQLVTGSNPSHFSGDKNPVEMVSYNAIRGSSNGATWPSSNAVDSSSFMGKLRARTDLDFDLPTEAQWEYACRAGTTTTYSYGDSANGNYMWYDANSSSQTHEVGTKQPNPWGLYDMHGNVWEWCLDWYDYASNLGGTDPKGPSSGRWRVGRGGCWAWSDSNCTSSNRGGNGASMDHINSNYFGFRLARSLTTNAQGGTLCSGANAPAIIDLSTETRTASWAETIRYSTAWETSAAGATAVVAVNGETLSSVTGSGATAWRPTRNGTYTLTHKVMNDGTQVGTTLTATFEVSHFPATPVIFPEGGVVDGWPVSVTISCATEGATIHYTTDGTEPTADNPRYSRFRVSQRTTVKAIAIKDGLVSEVAVAEYALGRCDNPVFTPSDGTTFEHSGQVVSIAWQGENGVLRYTTDGSDPTAESPVYGGPFTIDDSTVVKAKAFGDQFFDSAVVTANLTRVWVNVATPTITAASSFTGSKTKVSLFCATDGATIRYTLNGNEPNSHSTRYTGPFYVTNSCTVKAYAICPDYLDSAVATFAIEKVWGIGDTMGAPDHAFATGGDVPFFRVTDATAPLGEAMHSGTITHNQTSTMTTTITGPGTVAFQWKTSCEKDPDGWYMWDHTEFEVDGVVVAKLDGVTTWQTVSHDIAGDGSHTLVWRYVKDNIESEGDDCCRVANYRWTSAYTATQTTPEPVPYVWLRGYYPELADEYEAYEAAALATAANGENKVWECYVAGIDPTDADARFMATIDMVNGQPQIRHDPPLSAAEEAKREYRTLGKMTLDPNEEWTDVTDVQDLDAAGYRFFKTSVRMKE